jgi:hypothetical protein
LVAAASFASLGCDEKPAWQEPGPEAAFENFLMDWYRGEYEAAFETIALDDRERLTKPLETLEGKLDEENLPKKVDMLVVGRVDNPYDIKDVELAVALESAPEQGQEVTLDLTYHDGREGEATLVWSGERWLVDLPLEAGPVDDGAQEPDQAPSQAASEDAGVGENDRSDASGNSAEGDAGPPNSNEEQ